LGQLFLLQNSQDKAIREFKNALKVNPRAFRVHAILGSIYEAQKNLTKAMFYYREALKVEPSFAIAANNLAWILCETNGSLDEALSLAQLAKQTLPDVANIADTLGWIYYRKNVFTLAVSNLRQFIEKDPNNPIYHFHLGLAYWKSDEKQKARQMLAKAVRLKANFIGAEEARKVLAEL
jgi:Tfp pilus assembly protein PilF